MISLPGKWLSVKLFDQTRCPHKADRHDMVSSYDKFVQICTNLNGAQKVITKERLCPI